MALAPGTRIGTYEILATLGAGAMGEVYRARDVRLGREVAIKFMLDKVAADPDHVARFEREAQTLAALNHPNIAQIYGIEEAADGLALVMEMVDGPTLADRIVSGGISIEQTIYIALQLAAALEYAHERHVIHRDLKPANIKLRPDFTLKVLDFGLAKKMGGQHEGDETGKFVTSLTQPGTVFGTPGYMAPELLRGGLADARTDIFAFGIVLFELLTGTHPFQRPSIFEIAEAILNPHQPAWPAASHAIPEPLVYVVNKAMAKDVAQRYQNVAEMRIDLSQCLTVSGSMPAPALPMSGMQMPTMQSSVTAVPTPSAIVPPAASRGYLPLALGALALVGLAAVAASIWYVTRGGPSAPPAEVKHSQVTFIGNVRGIAFSPDGRMAAYATTGDTGGRVMVRDVAGGQALEIWKAELVVELQWTPDGSHVVVSGILNDQNGVWVVPRLGGAARRLPTRGAHLTVSPDGQNLALAMQNTKGFRIYPISGSGGERTIKMDGFQWLLGLDWGAKSNRIAVLTQAEDGSATVWTINPEGGELRKVHTDRNLASIRWSPLEPVVYAIRSRDEAAEVIKLQDRDSTGTEPQVILAGLPWDSSDPYLRQASLSTDGRRLLYIRGFAYANLWRMPIAGPPVPAPITQGTSRYGRPRVSPDGQWIATSVGTPAQSAIIKIPIAGGEPVPVTSGDAADSNPAWSRDGKQIAFLSIRANVPRIWVVDPDVRATTELKDSAAETQNDVSIDWLPDGRVLWTQPGSLNFAIRDLKTGAQETLLDKTAGWISDVRLSPNGQQFAIWWNREDDFDGLWLMHWPSREQKGLLRGDFYPAGWSTDSRSIYAYEFLQRNIVKVSAATGKMEPVGAFPLGALEGCDVSGDAKTIICAVRETKSDAWLVENFDSAVSR